VEFNLTGQSAPADVVVLVILILRLILKSLPAVEELEGFSVGYS